ncbi:MAG: TolC family protein, partial [Acidobacteriota bacterium]
MRRKSSAAPPRAASTTLLLLASLALLSACQSAPPSAPPLVRSGLDVPERWLDADASADAPVDAGDAWWRALGGDALDALVRETLAANRDLQIASARVAASAAQARIAGADRLPQISAGLNGSRNQQIFVGLPIPGQDGPQATKSDSFSSDLSISWEADLWGRLRDTERAAVADLVAVQADFDASRLSLAAETARGWFGLIEAAQQVALAGVTLDSRRLTAEWIDSRYRAGLIDAVDLRLARAELAQAEQALAQAERLRDAS